MMRLFRYAIFMFVPSQSYKQSHLYKNQNQADNCKERKMPLSQVEHHNDFDRYKIVQNLYPCAVAAALFVWGTA